MFRKSFLIAFAISCMTFASMTYTRTATCQEPVVLSGIRNEDNRFLARVERTIGKEPVYRGQPKYILIVLGKEARHRVWVVVDDDNAYVDLNGNGDLTEKGEKLKLKKNAVNDPEWTREIGILEDPISKLRHEDVSISSWDEGTIRISMYAAFANQWRPKLYGFANVRYSTRPAKAPVVHFGGHPAMELGIGTIDNRPSHLTAEIGTHGIGMGSFVYYQKSVYDIATGGPFSRLPKLETRLWPPPSEQKVRLPDLMLEYENEKGQQIRERSKIGYDIFERIYWLGIDPGEKNEKRNVKVTLSFMEWFEGDIGMRTRTVPYFQLKK